MTRMQGRVALVLGGANGIGAATSMLLAAEGAAVMVADIDEDAAAALTQRATASGRRVAFITADAASLDRVEAAVAATVAAFGGLDTAVHTVFADERGSVSELAEVGWRRTVDVGLSSAYRLAHAAVPVLVDAGARTGADASLLFVSSIQARLGYRNGPAYAAAKAGLEGLARQLAVDLGPRGVRANCVAPALVATERNRARWSADELGRRAARYPLGRIGSVEDVARAVLFLVSAEASFITGACLPVDGGLSIRSAVDPKVEQS